uniref:Uncharacterized protein n=1 Tax=Oryza brachyantha TaxID=4533 RepID=J3N4X1_ORYBR
VESRPGYVDLDRISGPRGENTSRCQARCTAAGFQPLQRCMPRWLPTESFAACFACFELPKIPATTRFLGLFDRRRRCVPCPHRCWCRVDGNLSTKGRKERDAKIKKWTRGS